MGLRQLNNSVSCSADEDPRVETSWIRLWHICCVKLLKKPFVHVWRNNEPLQYQYISRHAVCFYTFAARKQCLHTWVANFQSWMARQGILVHFVVSKCPKKKEFSVRNNFRSKASAHLRNPHWSAMSARMCWSRETLRRRASMLVIIIPTLQNVKLLMSYSELCL